ncbi:MAG TPA: hypothetical protein VKZ84_00440 [Bacteriovoracaceae bacterium]|nr:hypothetical protein [Bacteriovoracaceae bacterium]
MSALEILLALFILSFWTLFPLAIYFSTKDLSDNEKELMRLGSKSHRFMR